MNQIESYIQTLKIDEVPWHRLTTAYGRASDFPKLFQQIQDLVSYGEVPNQFVVC